MLLSVLETCYHLINCS